MKFRKKFSEKYVWVVILVMWMAILPIIFLGKSPTSPFFIIWVAIHAACFTYAGVVERRK